jgi:tripartite-type tricarboxylate transporter receptor subunit TctC
VPEVKKQIEASGYQVVGSTPAQLDAHVRAEIVRWAKVVKAAGVTAQ